MSSNSLTSVPAGDVSQTSTIKLIPPKDQIDAYTHVSCSVPVETQETGVIAAPTHYILMQ